MLHSETLRDIPSDPCAAFDRGDYLDAARRASPERWQHWAGLAAIGCTSGTTDALIRFTEPAARFHAGVSAWMDGDDDRALALLREAPGEHARRLADLIQHRPITALTQLPWNRAGSWDVLGELRDPAFRVLNVSFHKEDIPNRPYADVHEFVASGTTPAFYLAEMLEWHLIPPNVRELGCPVIGHSSDYDVHIQAIAPWLQIFDELLVLDSTQWRDMSALAPHAHVSVFPKVFGVPRTVPDFTAADRNVDVFLSGTVAHPYHPDKDDLLLRLLELDDIALRVVNGFDAPARYYRSLADAKICLNHVRHPGALPTRALEGLAMGCVVTVHEENVLHLFFNRATGVVPYGPRSGRLVDVVRRILEDASSQLAAAARGARLIREEFHLARVASQYLRFATVMAARPRALRHNDDALPLVQKRATIHKGWLPSYQFGGPLLTEWANASVERLQRQYRTSPSARVLNDISRERLLASYHLPNQGTWLPAVIAPLNEALSAFPEALVPRVNLIRICLHFGGDADVRRAIDVLDQTLSASPSSWSVEPLDDVLPWDFCPAFFNYRRYFDGVTASLSGESDATALTEIILASLHYYRGRYTGQLPGPLDEIEYAARATSLDPAFAEYELYYCRLLIERGRTSDLRDAAERLYALARRSVRLLEIADLARQLPQGLRGERYASVCAQADRFWAAVEMRENLPEPMLQPLQRDDVHGIAVR